MTITEMVLIYLSCMLTGFSVLEIFDNDGKYNFKYKIKFVGMVIVVSIVGAYAVYWIVNFRGG